MRRAKLARRFCAAGLALVSGLAAFGATERNVDGIRDNSFFVEEAYNTEMGVGQDIFNAT